MAKNILKKNNQDTSIILMTVGIILILVAISHWYLKFESLSLDREIITQYENQTKKSENTPKHIKISWFVDTDIEEHVLIENRWTISDDKASYLSSSASPGESGNIIIYGHNTRKILGNIRALKGNETIEITTKNGKTHLYSIETIKEVDPNDTKYLKPAENETLTLYTCSGFLDKKRFIVQAKPI